MFVITEIDTANIGRCRTQMAKLPRRAAGALHFNKESDNVRWAALHLFAKLPISVSVIETKPNLRHFVAREKAVRKVAQLAIVSTPQRIVLERDATLIDKDRKWLSAELGKDSPTEYLHLGKHDEPLLWISDGIGWALQRGGSWRTEAMGLVREWHKLG